MATKIPVTVITGFLGSGKTSRLGWTKWNPTKPCKCWVSFLNPTYI